MSRQYNQKYPWHRWMSKGRLVLRRGIDYHCTQGSICQQVRNAAARWGLRANLIEQEDRLIVILSPRTLSQT